MPCCGGGVEDTVANQSKEQTRGTASPRPAAEKSKPSKASTPASAVTPGRETAGPASSQSPASAPSPSPASVPPKPAMSTSDVVSEEPKPASANKDTSASGADNSSAAAAAADPPQQPDDAAPKGASGARPAKNVPAGFVSGTRKDQEISSGVQDRIAGLKASGLKTNNTGGKRMKTPRIITDTKESWDKEGNITREITRYITEPNGEKRTEKETVYIPAGEVEQQ